MLDKLQQLKSTALSELSKRTSSKGGNYVVALDIGTENVKALVSEIKDGEARIIGVGTAHQGLQDMQAGAIADISAVTANCNSALAKAEKQAGVSARAVVIGIAGELVKGRTTSVKVRRKDSKKPLEIEEVERIISIVQKHAFKQAKEQISDEIGGKDIDVQLVNSALVDMKIDGYTVTNPVGFQGKEVTVQLYTAFAPMIHIGALERVANELDMDLLAVAAEPFAVARSVVGDDSDAGLSAILIDVGGGTTDIAVLSEGGVQGTHMFGIGGRAYTKTVAKEMDVDFSEAERLKVSLSDGTAPSASRENIEKALQKTLDVWQSGVELSLESYTNLEQLPKDIMLCGGGSSLELLKESLENGEWYKDLPFTRKPRVHYITEEAVIGITDATGDAGGHTFVTAMGLLRVALDTIVQNDISTEKETAKEKIDRMLRV